MILQLRSRWIQVVIRRALAGIDKKDSIAEQTSTLFPNLKPGRVEWAHFEFCYSLGARHGQEVAAGRRRGGRRRGHEAREGGGGLFCDDGHRPRVGQAGLVPVGCVS